MLRLIGIMVMAMAAMNPQQTQADDTLRVLLTVGGVGYNTWIARMLARRPGVELAVRSVDEHPTLFTAEALADVDAVLMYHRADAVDAEQQAALLEFLQRGGGVVVLHHALANYAEWQHWWRDHVGGLYVMPNHPEMIPSQYSHAFRGAAAVAQPHLVTARLGDFLYLRDESYDRLWVAEEVSVLLRTSVSGSDSRLAWIGPSPSQRVVYIQPGHEELTLIDPAYLMLLEDALRWTAR